MDPRVKISSQDLQAQFAAAQQVDQLTAEVTQTRQQATHLHQQLQELRTNASSNSGVVNAVDALERKLAGLLGAQARSAPGMGPGAVNEDFTSFEYLGRTLPMLAYSIDGAPAAPTEGDLRALENARKIFDADLGKWNQITTTDVAQLNSVLRQNKLPTIE
jgi:hypothetical protein